MNNENTVPSIFGESRPAEQSAESVTRQMMVGRQAQEVQAAMVIAKRFPRNEVDAYNRIINACQRITLAEQAIYEYPRGGEMITGPSIRLAEAIAQNWGNIDFGIIELEQAHGESTVMAYAWDLETNTRQTKIFTVPHIRHTKKGDYPLTDPRDIYELIANQGARRQRACILGLIPGDIIESALNQCDKTLSLTDEEKEKLADKVASMCAAFKNEYAVPVSCLEGYIGCNVKAFSVQSVLRLRRVYQSLKDGMSKREDYFGNELPPMPNSAKGDVGADKPQNDKAAENETKAKNGSETVLASQGEVRLSDI